MRFIVQRVKKAEVEVENTVIGKIEEGFLVFVGVSQADTEAIADKMVNKLIGLRIFEDENGKTNLDIKTVYGELLIISQFTLYADCKKGNRPSFIRAGKPDIAKPMYEEMGKVLSELLNKNVQMGVFGGDMKIELLNDGPVTIIMNTKDKDNF